MMRRLALAALFVVACGAVNTAAQNSGCSLATKPLNFGTYTGAMIKSTTTWSVTCQGKSDGWYIYLYAGTGAGASVTNRKMTLVGGTAELSYSVFQDSGYSVNWGDTDTTDKAGNGSQQVVVYAELPGGQIVPPGTYTDTVNTITSSFTLTAVVLANCTIGTANLSFGNYTGASLNATSTITVNCTNLAPYNVGLDPGTATGATVTTRKMKITSPGTALLAYNLFSNPGYSINWGNTVGIDTVGGTGTGTAQVLHVYGQIPAGQFVAPGTYTDTIVATLTY
jgi:spore coat protein U-like protein